MKLEKIQDELQGFVAREVDGNARVTGLRPADGHAGLTYLFDIESTGSSKGYVLRLPPPGVRRKGNTDVYRQAPLLRSLHASGLPVPAVPWAQEHEGWFDLPFIVMERLPGRNLLVWEPHPFFERRPQAIQPLWAQTVTALGALHRFDWKTELPDWEAPRSPDQEIRYWPGIYQHAPEPEWLALAQDVEARLLASLPVDPPMGLVHGDYQPGNVMFDDNHRMTGIIDWELSHIGATTLDLGWMMMMADPQMWDPGYAPVHPLPVDEVVSLYEASVGRRIADAAWYQALSGFRLGAIACLNVKLHRKGQREDELWERIAPSIPRLFGHARQILDKEFT